MIIKIPDLRRLFKTKADPAYQAILMTLLGDNPIWTKRSIARLTEAGYQNCCTVFACINERAGGAAGVPWRLFRRGSGENAKKVEIEEHAILNLMRRPNPMEGGYFFRMKALAFLLIGGNSYLARIGGETGPPREMYTMRPDRTKVLPGNQFEPIRGYRYTVGSDKRDFEFEEVLHLRTFSPLDDWYGLSPIQVASKEIDIQSMSREWNMKLLQNDCRPPGGIIVEGTIKPEDRERLESKFEEKMRGYKNAGRPPVLEGGVRWEPWAISPKDMDWLNADKTNSRKICSVYNIDPAIIGDSENKTYNSYKEARKALYIEAILPDLDFFQDELNNWLVPAWGDDRLYLQYDKNSIDAIREELTAIYDRQSKAWWRTINQKLISCGDAPIGKAGDVIMVPSNLIPLGDISGNVDEE